MQFRFLRDVNCCFHLSMGSFHSINAQVIINIQIEMKTILTAVRWGPDKLVYHSTRAISIPGKEQERIAFKHFKDYRVR